MVFKLLFWSPGLETVNHLPLILLSKVKLLKGSSWMQSPSQLDHIWGGKIPQCCIPSCCCWTSRSLFPACHLNLLTCHGNQSTLSVLKLLRKCPHLRAVTLSGKAECNKGNSPTACPSWTWLWGSETYSQPDFKDEVSLNIVLHRGIRQQFKFHFYH